MHRILRYDRSPRKCQGAENARPEDLESLSGVFGFKHGSGELCRGGVIPAEALVAQPTARVVSTIRDDTVGQIHTVMTTIIDDGGCCDVWAGVWGGCASWVV
jgi:hypothetical protein